MQNTLAQFISGIEYKNISYKGTSPVVLKDGKPTESWMKEWSLDKRLDKFFEFCQEFDLRRDQLLAEDYQIFSHRLHWHEHPFCDIMKKVTDPKLRLWYTLTFSFSNEHWGTLTRLMYQGEDNLREHFKENRHARNDLFQIYYPKGTNVKEWLIDGPKKAAEEMYETLERRRQWLGRPFTMMEYAKLLEGYFKTEQNFRSPLYPCKNTARYMAMAYPDIVDPESVLFGGTGHFDGMAQIFGVNLNGKVSYEIDADGQFIPQNKNAHLWLEQMHILRDDVRNPMLSQKMLNIEDKTCFFYKHIAISHGVKSPTKRIPYSWIFPETFSLRK
jgi:hypothetical protein